MRNKCKNKKCCCNCDYQLTLTKHPENKSFGKGSISEGCGWACLALFGENNYRAVFGDTEHSSCEMYKRRE